jgi:hypothetical protein
MPNQLNVMCPGETVIISKRVTRIAWNFGGGEIIPNIDFHRSCKLSRQCILNWFHTALSFCFVVKTTRFTKLTTYLQTCQLTYFVGEIIKVGLKFLFHTVYGNNYQLNINTLLVI